jgi:hypothetical protein
MKEEVSPDALISESLNGMNNKPCENIADLV